MHDTHTIPLQRTHKPGHRGAELEAGRWDGLRPAACAALGGAPRRRFDYSVCPEGANKEADSGSEGAG